jgi:hypothetical protein
MAPNDRTVMLSVGPTPAISPAFLALFVVIIIDFAWCLLTSNEKKLTTPIKNAASMKRGGSKEEYKEILSSQEKRTSTLQDKVYLIIKKIGIKILKIISLNLIS